MQLRGAENGEMARVGAEMHLRRTECGEMARIGAEMHLRGLRVEKWQV
jgi:hypothetical protein